VNGLSARQNSQTTRTWRQALLMALDRETMVKTILSGLGEVADSPMLPTQEGYKKTKVWPMTLKSQSRSSATRASSEQEFLVYYSGSAFTGETAVTKQCK
jgi:ABC-type transport system substrate-binding protein